MGMIVAGVDHAADDLENLARNAGDMRGTFRHVLTELEHESSKTFSSRGASIGAPWKPLDPSTLARKKGHPALVKSGGLEHSLTLPNSIGAIRQARKLTFSFGTKHPLAHLHQFGTKGGHVPARTVLKLTPAIRSMIVRKIHEHLTSDL